MKKRYPIPTAKKLHEIFVYKDGHLFWRNDAKYGKIKAGDHAGYKSQDGYVRVGIEGVYYVIHRLIWRMHHPRGVMPFILDHIDGDRSNNAISNLRNVTHGDNIKNQHPELVPPMQSSGKLRRLLNQ